MTDQTPEAIAALLERHTQFNLMQLPGQPFGMHMGTSYLVNDLASTVIAIRTALTEAEARVAELEAALCEAKRQSFVFEMQAIPFSNAAEVNFSLGMERAQTVIQKLRKEASAVADGVRFQALDDARQAIRALSPMTPLAAAMLLPEVQAMRDALVEIDNGPGTEYWAPEYQHCQAIARAALAATEVPE